MMWFRAKVRLSVRIICDRQKNSSTHFNVSMSKFHIGQSELHIQIQEKFTECTRRISIIFTFFELTANLLMRSFEQKTASEILVYCIAFVMKRLVQDFELKN